jgi:hypothetical protein
MKKLFLLLAGLAVSTMIFAQAPESFKYQAIARDGTGAVLANKTVTFRMSIIEGTVTGDIVYSEKHTATTNEFGLVNLEIGRGTSPSGTFEGINWGVDQHFLKVEMDPNGGSDYLLLGSSELLSVPYALYAKTVQTGDKWGNQTVATDVTLDGNGTLLQPLKLGNQRAVTGQVLKFNGTSWLPGTDLTGGADPGGANGQVQFNSSGAFGGDSKLFWNNTTKKLGIGTNTPQYSLGIDGGAGYPEIHFTSDWSGSNATDGVRFGMGNLSTWLWNYEDSRISFGTNNLERMAIARNGDIQLFENLSMQQGKKIGIGVDNPTHTLEMLNGTTTYAKFFHSTSGIESSDGFLLGITQTGNRSYVWNYEDGPIYFGTNNIFRMTVSPEGNLGIGTTLPDYKLDVNGPVNLNKSITTGQALLVNGSEALWYNGSYFSWGFGGDYNYFADEVTIGTTANPGYDLVVNGTAAKTGGGSWSNLSDIRLKNLLGNYEKGLREIAELQPVRYTYKEGNPRQLNSTEEQIGFIAQDVQKVFPEAVNQGKDGYLDFNLHSINVALVNAVKELKIENDKLKAENIRLKADQAQLNSRIGKIENYLKAEAKK